MHQPVWIYRKRLETDETLFPRDAAEKARVRRLLDQAIAQDYLHARELMRALLSDTMLLGSETVTLQSWDNARPSAAGFENTGLSWSRSGPHAFAGLIRDGSIGVDIEKIEPRETSAMMRMISTDAELRIVSDIADKTDGLTVFYRLWCAKEAVLKWRGEGLRGNARSVDVPAAIISGEAEQAELCGATLQMIRPSSDCMAAIAFSG